MNKWQSDLKFLLFSKDKVGTKFFFGGGGVQNKICFYFLPKFENLLF